MGRGWVRERSQIIEALKLRYEHFLIKNELKNQIIINLY